MVSLGLTWFHLDSLGLTWTHLTHLGSLGLAWTHLGSLGLTGTHWDSLGLTWAHLDSLGLTLTHLDSLGLTWTFWTHWVSLGLNWVSGKETKRPHKDLLLFTRVLRALTCVLLLFARVFKWCRLKPMHCHSSSITQTLKPIRFTTKCKQKAYFYIQK